MSTTPAIRTEDLHANDAWADKHDDPTDRAAKHGRDEDIPDELRATFGLAPRPIGGTAEEQRGAPADATPAAGPGTDA